MIHFDHSPKYWPLHNREQLNLMHITSKGRDLDDMLANAEISLQDWHGNEGPHWELGDLHPKDYELVVQMFLEKLRGAHE